jgi:very-short-patch-repair endonuclease
MQGRKPHTVEGVADQGKVDFAREQRKEPTEGEQVLWQLIRGRKLGVKFRRQHPIEDFVLDFYCAEIRLAIEVDGTAHDGREGYDRWRDDVLAGWGIEVVRVREWDVTEQAGRVLERIRRQIDDRLGS